MSVTPTENDPVCVWSVSALGSFILKAGSVGGFGWVDLQTGGQSENLLTVVKSFNVKGMLSSCPDD